jgi:hypothetical protein
MMGARVIDQDLPHHPRGDAEEVRAVLPGDRVVTEQLQVRLVNERGGLKRMAVPFPSKASGRSLLEVAIDERQEPVARL